MSLARRQAFIAAPLTTVWELVSDVGCHPEWWPRVLEVECEGLEVGCTYREVVSTPFGKEEMELVVGDLDHCRRLAIHCLNTGTFVRFALAEAQGGTFVDGEMGMDRSAGGLGMRAFDAVVGQRYFRSWLGQTLAALESAAKRRDEAPAGADPT